MRLRDKPRTEFHLSRGRRTFTFTKEGARDVIDGFYQWRLSYLLGSSDFRRRFARSRLGQIWIMISSAVTLTTMGVVWSYLWRQPVQEMLPFIAVSMMVWLFVSGVLSEATSVLPTSGHYFLNQYLPASTVIIALIYRHTLTFLLNITIPIGIVFFLGAPIGRGVWLVVPGLLLVLISCFWIAYVIAILSTRFRDFVQIVNSLLQVAIYLTPILWKPEQIPLDAQGLVNLNPLAALLSVVRDPLLGRPAQPTAWVIAAAISIGGLALALPFIGRYRRRLVYWL